MYAFDTTMIFSGYSIVFAVIINIIRYKKVLKSFHPFIYFTWLALFIEILGVILAYLIANNAVSSNIYVLLELFLILWLFKNWRNGKPRFYKTIVIAAIAVWCLDTLVLHSITHFSSIYRIFYSLVIVYFAINQVNLLIVNERRSLLKDARFILCLAFIVFFAFKAFLETFYLIELGSPWFHSVLEQISTFLNFIINLVYALAALWIPTKQRFSLPY